MRFYYVSPISLMLLGVIYLVGTGLLLWFWSWLRKRMKKAWIVMVPLFALLFIGPVAEEYWIAWNFGQLCKKDAGIFIRKAVEVEGFYDDTHSWRADKLEAAGFRWMEGRDRTKDHPVYWRHDRAGHEIRSMRIDHPTARYHYRRISSHLPVGHGVKKFENVVVDTETKEILGRYLNYYRSAPWFFLGLDRPTIPCRETEEDTRKHGTMMVYVLALIPVSSVESTQEQE